MVEISDCVTCTILDEWVGLMELRDMDEQIGLGAGKGGCGTDATFKERKQTRK
jgi:hypothetical protein